MYFTIRTRRNDSLSHRWSRIFIVMVYFYAKNQGFKDAALDYLESGVETANKVDENDKAKDKEIDAKLEQFSGDNALDFGCGRITQRNLKTYPIPKT